MAPLQQIKKDATDKRVQTILDVASRLSGQLTYRHQISTNDATELDALIEYFPLQASSSLTSKSPDLDKLGSTIWNQATHIIRDGADGQAENQQRDTLDLAIRLRTLAYLMLHAAHSSLPRLIKGQESRARVFRLALKTSRFCLEHGALDGALKVLESCSEYASAVERGSPILHMAKDDSDEQRKVLQRLAVQYWLHRMMLASKTERPDIAQHFYSKIEESVLADSADLKETAAELCYESGKHLLSRQQTAAAKQWLERANDLLKIDDLIDADHNFEDLRLAIVATLVGVLCKGTDVHDADRAWNLVDDLGKLHGLGDRLAVLSMQLQVALRFSGKEDRIEPILIRMVKTTVLTEETFRIIMQSIHKAKKNSATAACRVLQLLIINRILPDLRRAMEIDTPMGDNDDAEDSERFRDWLEKGIVTYTLLSTSSKSDLENDILSNLSSLFDSIAQSLNRPLSAKATHALQTLMWKASQTPQSGDTKAWCTLLRHSLFDSTGLMNKARIGRRIMMEAEVRKDYDAAREAFFQMPRAAQNENITRYLAYKIALQSGDDALANECLDFLLKHSGKDRKYMYACVLDAQRSHNRKMAITALQAMVANPPKHVHLPALLRCTARLFIGELEDQTRPLDEIMEELLRVFETAASNTRVFRQDSEDTWRAEILWWSKNAYNLTLRVCAEAHPRHIFRLIHTCIMFLNCYPDDGGPMLQDELLSKKQLCYFLAASALIVLSRSEDERSEASLQAYNDVRKEVAAYIALGHGSAAESEEAARSHQRTLEMLKFDLESVFKLEQWDQLDPALEGCLIYQGASRWDMLADLVIIIYERASTLNVDPPAVAKIPDLLQRIINETWKRDQSTVQLARWLRVTYTLISNANDERMSLSLVRQAARIAQKGQAGKNEAYPEDELQWLATTAFNRAVDFLAGGEQKEADDWIEGALELARYAADNGSLHACLTKNRNEAEERMKGRVR